MAWQWDCATVFHLEIVKASRRAPQKVPKITELNTFADILAFSPWSDAHLAQGKEKLKVTDWEKL
jgi:hypothetical protein